MPTKEVNTMAGAAPMTLSSVRMLVDADIFLYQLCGINLFFLNHVDRGHGELNLIPDHP
jgi:hypothetical protein